MPKPVIDFENGWKGYEAGEFYVEEVLQRLCCRFSQEERYVCAGCNDILSASLSSLGGGWGKRMYLKTLSSHLWEKHGVRIEHANYGAYHRHYCESCPVNGRDHCSLDTDKELFDHLKSHHHLKVRYVFKFTVTTLLDNHL